MNIVSKIEAILFYKNEPVSIKKLAQILNASEAEVRGGIHKLSEALNHRGVTLIQTETDVVLATAREAESLIETITKEELSRDIGKAGLETLSIILYNGETSRKDIDYIRGVNSTFILRNLAARGLVERIPSATDARSFVYRPSLQLLAHLGVREVNELPEYTEFREELAKAKKNESEEEKQHNGE